MSQNWKGPALDLSGRFRLQRDSEAAIATQKIEPIVQVIPAFMNEHEAAAELSAAI